MDEEDVIIHVLKWLEKAYASSSNIKVCRGSPTLDQMCMWKVLVVFQ
jgi:hypothetical protein